MVEQWGLAGDRRWMLVDHRGHVVTARTYPQLVLVTPELQAGGLLVQVPYADPLLVPTPDGDVLATVRIGSSELVAAPASDAGGWCESAPRDSGW